MSAIGEVVVPIFSDATVEVPQVPYQGVIEVGDAVVALADEDAATTVIDEFAGLSLAPGTSDFAEALARTLVAHGEADVSNNQGLHRGLGMAMELVQSGFFRAVALLRRSSNEQTNTVGPLHPLEIADAVAFLSEVPNRAIVRQLFGAVKEHLATHASVQERVAAYKEAITAISKRYWAQMLNARGNEERLRTLREQKVDEINEQRGILMSVVAPEIFAAVEPFTTRVAGVHGFAGAIACGMPSPEMFAKHLYET